MSPERSERKRSRRTQESIADHEDIISNFPRDVIAYILGKMPIREAVRTSVLSNKWRFYYLHIPQLVFDDQFHKELDSFFVKRRSEDISKPKFCLFDEIVTKSLLLHGGGLEKFKVTIPYPPSTATPDVNKWILSLSLRNIKQLMLLYTDVSTHLHKLPPYFFSCLGLTFLRLQNFALSPPVEFKGFLKLHHLILIGVDFANNSFESFISNCPLLVRLVLRRCSGIRHFNIRGSNLKRLLISANDKFESISLKEAPNLTEISVKLERVARALEGNPISELVKFAGSSTKVKVFRLNGKFLQFLAVTPVPPLLLASPSSLKTLEFYGVNFMDFDQISAVVCLLRSAPNLQELHIEASTIKQNQEQVSGYLKLLDCTDIPLGKLRLVKLTKISNFGAEFEFIRFLLFSSPSLSTMSILEHPRLKAEEALNITRTLLEFRLPSSVSIHFSRDSKT